MSAKQILFDEYARESLKVGVDIVANTVRATLGPRGRNVALGTKFGAPIITHDGVTVAKEIEIKDRFINLGAQLTKEAASRTGDVAGDGTTTSTVLAQAMIHEGIRNIAAGANPMAIKRGIEAATTAVVEALRQMATPVQGREGLTQIATLASADPEIGKLIGEAMDKIGASGVISVEESRGIESEVEYVEGMSFDRGYVSPYLVTDAERQIATLDEPYILITDKRISSNTDVVPILEEVLRSGKREFLIICDDFDGEALATLIVNKMRGNLNAVAVEGSGLWGQPEGSARRYRHHDWRPGHLGKSGPPPRRCHAGGHGWLPPNSDHQRRNQPARRPRLRRCARTARQAAQSAYRRRKHRLRPREAAGTAREAVRRRGDHSRRRRHRIRAQRAQGAGGRRVARGARRGGGRDRPRWWSGAAARRGGDRQHQYRLRGDDWRQAREKRARRSSGVDCRELGPRAAQWS